MKRRNTPARAAILSILENAASALSQDMIEEQLAINTDRVTIYRLLNRFVEDGITHKVIAADGKSYFALCQTCNHADHYHDHFHFSCTKCGKIECLKEEIKIQLPKGYHFENMNCIVNGICAACS
jgi:Fur family ferric uptake transcriptional regulator